MIAYVQTRRIWKLLEQKDLDTGQASDLFDEEENRLIDKITELA